MGDSDNDKKQPKFRSGPIVVWVSVGIAVFWAALLLFFGYGANSRHLIVEFFHRNDSRLQGMLRKFTRRGTHALGG